MPISSPAISKPTSATESPAVAKNKAAITVDSSSLTLSDASSTSSGYSSEASPVVAALANITFPPLAAVAGAGGGGASVADISTCGQSVEVMPSRMLSPNSQLAAVIGGGRVGPRGDAKALSVPPPPTASSPSLQQQSSSRNDVVAAVTRGGGSLRAVSVPTTSIEGRSHHHHGQCTASREAAADARVASAVGGRESSTSAAAVAAVGVGGGGPMPPRVPDTPQREQLAGDPLSLPSPITTIRRKLQPSSGAAAPYSSRTAAASNARAASAPAAASSSATSTTAANRAPTDCRPFPALSVPSAHTAAAPSSTSAAFSAASLCAIANSVAAAVAGGGAFGYPPLKTGAFSGGSVAGLLLSTEEKQQQQQQSSSSLMVMVAASPATAAQTPSAAVVCDGFATANASAATSPAEPKTVPRVMPSSATVASRGGRGGGRHRSSQRTPSSFATTTPFETPQHHATLASGRGLRMAGEGSASLATPATDLTNGDVSDGVFDDAAAAALAAAAIQTPAAANAVGAGGHSLPHEQAEQQPTTATTTIDAATVIEGDSSSSSSLGVLYPPCCLCGAAGGLAPSTADAPPSSSSPSSSASPFSPVPSSAPHHYSMCHLYDGSYLAIFVEPFNRVVATRMPIAAAAAATAAADGTNRNSTGGEGGDDDTVADGGDETAAVDGDAYPPISRATTVADVLSAIRAFPFLSQALTSELRLFVTTASSSPSSSTTTAAAPPSTVSVATWANGHSHYHGFGFYGPAVAGGDVAVPLPPLAMPMLSHIPARSFADQRTSCADRGIVPGAVLIVTVTDSGRARLAAAARCAASFGTIDFLDASGNGAAGPFAPMPFNLLPHSSAEDMYPALACAIAAAPPHHHRSARSARSARRLHSQRLQSQPQASVMTIPPQQRARVSSPRSADAEGNACAASPEPVRPETEAEAEELPQQQLFLPPLSSHHPNSTAEVTVGGSPQQRNVIYATNLYRTDPRKPSYCPSAATAMTNLYPTPYSSFGGFQFPRPPMYSGAGRNAYAAPSSFTRASSAPTDAPSSSASLRPSADATVPVPVSVADGQPLASVAASTTVRFDAALVAGAEAYRSLPVSQRPHIPLGRQRALAAALRGSEEAASGPTPATADEVGRSASAPTSFLPPPPVPENVFFSNPRLASSPPPPMYGAAFALQQPLQQSPLYLSGGGGGGGGGEHFFHPYLYASSFLQQQQQFPWGFTSASDEHQQAAALAMAMAAAANSYGTTLPAPFSSFSSVVEGGGDSAAVDKPPEAATAALVEGNEEGEVDSSSTDAASVALLWLQQQDEAERAALLQRQHMRRVAASASMGATAASESQQQQRCEPSLVTSHDAADESAEWVGAQQQQHNMYTDAYPLLLRETRRDYYPFPFMRSQPPPLLRGTNSSTSATFSGLSVNAAPFVPSSTPSAFAAAYSNSSSPHAATIITAPAASSSPSACGTAELLVPSSRRVVSVAVLDGAAKTTADSADAALSAASTATAVVSPTGAADTAAVVATVTTMTARKARGQKSLKRGSDAAAAAGGAMQAAEAAEAVRSADSTAAEASGQPSADSNNGAAGEQTEAANSKVQRSVSAQNIAAQLPLPPPSASAASSASLGAAAERCLEGDFTPSTVSATTPCAASAGPTTNEVPLPSSEVPFVPNGSSPKNVAVVVALEEKSPSSSKARAANDESTAASVPISSAAATCDTTPSCADAPTPMLPTSASAVAVPLSHSSSDTARFRVGQESDSPSRTETPSSNQQQQPQQKAPVTASAAAILRCHQQSTATVEPAAAAAVPTFPSMATLVKGREQQQQQPPSSKAHAVETAAKSAALSVESFPAISEAIADEAEKRSLVISDTNALNVDAEEESLVATAVAEVAAVSEEADDEEAETVEEMAEEEEQESAEDYLRRILLAHGTTACPRTAQLQLLVPPLVALQAEVCGAILAASESIMSDPPPALISSAALLASLKQQQQNPSLSSHSLPIRTGGGRGRNDATAVAAASGSGYVPPASGPLSPAEPRRLRGRLTAAMGRNTSGLLRPLHETCDAVRLRSIAFRLWAFQVCCENLSSSSSSSSSSLGGNASSRSNNNGPSSSSRGGQQQSAALKKSLQQLSDEVGRYRELCTVCVSFVPAEMGNFQLRLLLECYGIVLAVRVIMPKGGASNANGSSNSTSNSSNNRRGGNQQNQQQQQNQSSPFKMVFVEFSCPEEAALAVADLDGHSPAKGKYLRVEYASRPIAGRLRYDAMVREAHLIDDYGAVAATHKRADLVIPNVPIKCDDGAAALYAALANQQQQQQQQRGGGGGGSGGSSSSPAPLRFDVHPTWREPPLNADAIGHSKVVLPASAKAASGRQSRAFNFYGASGEALQHRPFFLCPSDGRRYWFLQQQTASSAVKRAASAMSTTATTDLHNSWAREGFLGLDRLLPPFGQQQQQQQRDDTSSAAAATTAPYYLAPCAFGLTVADLSAAFISLIDLRRFVMKPSGITLGGAGTSAGGKNSDNSNGGSGGNKTKNGNNNSDGASVDASSFNVGGMRRSNPALLVGLPTAAASTTCANGQQSGDLHAAMFPPSSTLFSFSSTSSSSPAIATTVAASNSITDDDANSIAPFLSGGASIAANASTTATTEQLRSDAIAAAAHYLREASAITGAYHSAALAAAASVRTAVLSSVYAFAKGLFAVVGGGDNSKHHHSGAADKKSTAALRRLFRPLFPSAAEEEEEEAVVDGDEVAPSAHNNEKKTSATKKGGSGRAKKAPQSGRSKHRPSQSSKQVVTLTNTYADLFTVAATPQAVENLLSLGAAASSISLSSSIAVGSSSSSHPPSLYAVMIAEGTSAAFLRAMAAAGYALPTAVAAPIAADFDLSSASGEEVKGDGSVAYNAEGGRLLRGLLGVGSLESAPVPSVVALFSKATAAMAKGAKAASANPPHHQCVVGATRLPLSSAVAFAAIGRLLAGADEAASDRVGDSSSASTPMAALNAYLPLSVTAAMMTKHKAPLLRADNANSPLIASPLVAAVEASLVHSPFFMFIGVFAVGVRSAAIDRAYLSHEVRRRHLREADAVLADESDGCAVPYPASDAVALRAVAKRQSQQANAANNSEEDDDDDDADELSQEGIEGSKTTQIAKVTAFFKFPDAVTRRQLLLLAAPEQFGAYIASIRSVHASQLNATSSSPHSSSRGGRSGGGGRGGSSSSPSSAALPVLFDGPTLVHVTTGSAFSASRILCIAAGTSATTGRTVGPCGFFFPSVSVGGAGKVSTGVASANASASHVEASAQTRKNTPSDGDGDADATSAPSLSSLLVAPMVRAATLSPSEVSARNTNAATNASNTSSGSSSGAIAVSHHVQHSSAALDAVRASFAKVMPKGASITIASAVAETTVRPPPPFAALVGSSSLAATHAHAVRYVTVASLAPTSAADTMNLPPLSSTATAAATAMPLREQQYHQQQQANPSSAADVSTISSVAVVSDPAVLASCAATPTVVNASSVSASASAALLMRSPSVVSTPVTSAAKAALIAALLTSGRSATDDTAASDAPASTQLGAEEVEAAASLYFPAHHAMATAAATSAAAPSPSAGLAVVASHQQRGAALLLRGGAGYVPQQLSAARARSAAAAAAALQAARDANQQEEKKQLLPIPSEAQCRDAQQVLVAYGAVYDEAKAEAVSALADVFADADVLFADVDAVASGLLVSVRAPTTTAASSYQQRQHVAAKVSASSAAAAAAPPLTRRQLAASVSLADILAASYPLLPSDELPPASSSSLHLNGNNYSSAAHFVGGETSAASVAMLPAHLFSQSALRRACDEAAVAAKARVSASLTAALTATERLLTLTDSRKVTPISYERTTATVTVSTVVRRSSSTADQRRGWEGGSSSPLPQQSNGGVEGSGSPFSSSSFSSSSPSPSPKPQQQPLTHTFKFQHQKSIAAYADACGLRACLLLEASALVGLEGRASEEGAAEWFAASSHLSEMLLSTNASSNADDNPSDYAVAMLMGGGDEGMDALLSTAAFMGRLAEPSAEALAQYGDGGEDETDDHHISATQASTARVQSVAALAAQHIGFASVPPTPSVPYGSSSRGGLRSSTATTLSPNDADAEDGGALFGRCRSAARTPLSPQVSAPLPSAAANHRTATATFSSSSARRPSPTAAHVVTMGPNRRASTPMAYLEPSASPAGTPSHPLTDEGAAFAVGRRSTARLLDRNSCVAASHSYNALRSHLGTPVVPPSSSASVSATPRHTATATAAANAVVSCSAKLQRVGQQPPQQSGAASAVCRARVAAAAHCRHAIAIAIARGAAEATRAALATFEARRAQAAAVAPPSSLASAASSAFRRLGIATSTSSSTAPLVATTAISASSSVSTSAAAAAAAADPVRLLFSLVRDLCTMARDGAERYASVLEAWRAEVGDLKQQQSQRCAGEGPSSPHAHDGGADATPLRLRYGSALLTFGYLEGRSLAARLLQVGALLEGGTAPHLAAMLYHEAWTAADGMKIVQTTIANNKTTPQQQPTSVVFQHGGGYYVNTSALSSLRAGGGIDASVLSTASSAWGAAGDNSNSSALSNANNINNSGGPNPTRPVAALNAAYYRTCVAKLREASQRCQLVATLFPAASDALVDAGRAHLMMASEASAVAASAVASATAAAAANANSNPLLGNALSSSPAHFYFSAASSPAGSRAGTPLFATASHCGGGASGGIAASSALLSATASPAANRSGGAVLGRGSSGVCVYPQRHHTAAFSSNPLLDASFGSASTPVGAFAHHHNHVAASSSANLLNLSPSSVLALAPPLLHRWHVLFGACLLRDESIFNPCIGEIEQRKEALRTRGLM